MKSSLPQTRIPFQSRQSRWAQIILGLTCICASALSYGQSEAWVARYNGPANGRDRAQSVNVDLTGNVYVTGTSVGSTSYDDYATLKYATDGTLLWERRYNGPGNSIDIAADLAVDAWGNVYVTGYSYAINGGYDYDTVKYNNDGVLLWARRYNGPANNYDFATDLAVDASGNVYVTGYSNGGGGFGDFDYATVKYDTDGNLLWARRYNGPGNNYDNPTDLAVDASGNIYVTGYSGAGGSSYDYATVKYNTDGNLLWARSYNGPASNEDIAQSVKVDVSGNVYVTGHSKGVTSSEDYATLKYASDGTLLWERRYNGPGNNYDVATDLAVDALGNAYVTGGSSTGFAVDYATLKYDTDGNLLWERRYNGPANNSDYGQAVKVDSSGNVYVTGYSYGGSSGYDYATLKYATDGGLLWAQRYVGPVGHDFALDLAVDSMGNAYVTGYSSGIGTGEDYATIKYMGLLPCEVHCPEDITVSNDPGVCGAVVTYTTPVGADNCPGAATVQMTGLSSGATFPIGTTVNTFEVTDAVGDKTACSFSVTVNDTETPKITCLGAMVVNADPLVCTAVVNGIGPISAGDNCSGYTIAYTLAGATTGSGINDASGSVFNIGVTTVTYTITDAAGLTASCSFTVTVLNPNPVVTLTEPASGSLYAINTPVNFTATFTDAGGGTHTGTWLFDSISQAATIVEPSGATPGSANATYTFTEAGVYTVKLTVNDSCGGSGTADHIGGMDLLVVVYDPSDGFVTGGGWINSPAGAYVADPTLSGKANFGFVSKYQKGANVPTGNTEFQFKAGNLNFSSTAYQWLVVAGTKAQYKGDGTINGAGNFGFLLTATDGQITGGGGVDKFRIKIWEKATSVIVYDNAMGASDDIDSANPQVISGGSIVIHKVK